MTEQTEEDVIKLPVEELHFDSHNPRLAEFGIADKTEDEILNILWDAMDVRELVMSMAASGFFQHEALIVAEENGKKIVIEGNRRLAALKAILGLCEVGENWSIPEISSERKAEMRVVPAIISTRAESWRFLGFKHVNGAAKWTSYAKAQYIAHVHENYSQSLEAIANQIGDRFGTVRRLFCGLMVLRQAERTKVYNLDNRYNKRLAFSHLYTGMGYEGFREFLGLDRGEPESQEPVPEDKLKQLGEICTWLYGDKTQERQPVVRSQNPYLRQLNQILTHREAVTILRETGNFDQAFEATRPSAELFESSLVKTKQELQNAKAHLAEGYDKSESLLRTAGSVANLADSIYTEMDNMTNPRPKNSRVSD